MTELFWGTPAPLFMHNSKSGASKFKFGGIVGIDPTNGIVAKEIPECPN